MRVILLNKIFRLLAISLFLDPCLCGFLAGFFSELQTIFVSIFLPDHGFKGSLLGMSFSEFFLLELLFFA